jgi:hypothetical protein
MVALAFLCACATRPPAQPRLVDLVVLITVDQLRPDYLDRFSAQLTGGLGRIRRESVFFPNGLQDHLVTATAPGHATLLSGREGAHTGIVTNRLGVPDSTSPLVGGNGAGASPKRFRGTALLDWLRAGDPDTRVLSVSRKDRGAILPVGRGRGDVYWFVRGGFTTSRYYADALPDWVEEWNRALQLSRFAGWRWDLLLGADAYPEPDDEPYENGGRDRLFPHSLPSDVEGVRKQIGAVPIMDSLTLAFALRGVDQLQLGRRGHTDLLAVSLSTTDAIGAAFGPDSREIHDHILRLDRYLGAFLDSLSRRVSAQRIALVLTADHGIGSFPERLSRQGQTAGRVDLQPLVARTDSQLAARCGESFQLRFDNGLLTAEVARLGGRGISVDSLSAAFADAVARHPAILRVYTPRTLGPAAANDTLAGRIRRSLPTDLGWLAVIVARPGFLFSGEAMKGEHGTMNAVDARVPIAFVLPGVPARTIERRVRTVDIAPTLAAYLGVQPLELLDGTAIPETRSH